MNERTMLPRFAELWNLAVQMKQPTLGVLCRECGLKDLVRVRPDDSGLLLANSCLFVQFRAMAAGTERDPILLVRLIPNREEFPSLVGLLRESLPPFSIGPFQSTLSWDQAVEIAQAHQLVPLPTTVERTSSGVVERTLSVGALILRYRQYRDRTRLASLNWYFSVSPLENLVPNITVKVGDGEGGKSGRLG